MPGFQDTTAHQTLTLVGISAALTVLLGALAVIFPSAGSAFFRRIEQFLSAFANRKNLSITVLFFAVIAVRLAVLPFSSVPVLGIHDEFISLLIAATSVPF